MNAGASEGLLRVRVSDENRKTIEGFGYDDCRTFTGDSVRHAVQWQSRSISELKGRVVRLEFYLQDADLYTFRAAGD